MNKRLFSLALVIALLPAVALALPPKTVRASYELYGNDILVGNVQETFTQANGKYRIDSTTTATGIAVLFKNDRITRVSTGLVTSEGLKPQFFEEKRTSRGKVRGATAHFDWEHNQVNLAHDDKSEQAPLPAGTLDWSSLFYQFLFKKPQRELLTVTLTDCKRVETYQYRFAGDANVGTTAGKFQTAHYVRVANQGERRTEIWLARDKSYLPVRVTHEEGGIVIEQRLVALTFN